MVAAVPASRPALRERGRSASNNGQVGPGKKPPSGWPAAENAKERAKWLLPVCPSLTNTQGGTKIEEEPLLPSSPLSLFPPVRVLLLSKHLHRLRNPETGDGKLNSEIIAFGKGTFTRVRRSPPVSALLPVTPRIGPQWSQTRRPEPRLSCA